MGGSDQPHSFVASIDTKTYEKLEVQELSGERGCFQLTANDRFSPEILYCRQMKSHVCQ